MNIQKKYIKKSDFKNLQEIQDLQEKFLGSLGHERGLASSAADAAMLSKPQAIAKTLDKH